MNRPPEKKRRVIDEWGEDDDFDQILTQHVNLEQIDYMVESSQTVSNITEVKFKNGIKNHEVVKTKNNFYQRHNSFGSPVTLNKKIDSKITDAKKEKEQEQLMFAKDGEIKNLKMRLAAAQKESFNQRMQASAEQKKLFDLLESEKKTMTNEIQVLKTELEFKEHELKKQKFKSQSETVKFPTSITSSDTSPSIVKNKKKNNFPQHSWSCGFQTSANSSKVSCKNQECQTVSMGVNVNNSRKPFKLSAGISQKPCSLLVDMHELQEALVHESTARDSTLHCLFSEGCHDTPLRQPTSLTAQATADTTMETLNGHLFFFITSLKDQFKQFQTQQSQLTSQFFSHGLFQQPIIYSDFYENRYNSFYKPVPASVVGYREGEKATCTRHHAATIPHTATNHTKTCQQPSCSKLCLNKGEVASTGGGGDASQVQRLSRNFNTLKYFVLQHTECNLPPIHLHGLEHLLFQHLTTKSCFQFPQLTFPIIDIITLLVHQPSLHHRIKYLFSKGVLLKIFIKNNTNNNNNKNNKTKPTKNFEVINVDNDDEDKEDDDEEEKKKVEEDDDEDCCLEGLERGTREGLYYKMLKLLEGVSAEAGLQEVLCAGGDDTCLLPSVCRLCSLIRAQHPCLLSCMADRLFLRITSNLLTSIITSSSLSSSSTTSSPPSLKLQHCQCFFELSKEIFRIIEHSIEKFVGLHSHTESHTYNHTDNNTNNYMNTYTDDHTFNHADIHSDNSRLSYRVFKDATLTIFNNSHKSPSARDNHTTTDELPTTTPINPSTDPPIILRTNTSNTTAAFSPTSHRVSTTQMHLFTNAIQAELLLQDLTALQSLSQHMRRAFTTCLVMHVGVMRTFKTFLFSHASLLSKHEYLELLNVVTCHLNHVNPEAVVDE